MSTPGTADVALWARQVRDATKGRDAAVVAMRAGSAPLREIASAAGLTTRAVVRILDRSRRKSTASTEKLRRTG